MQKFLCREVRVDLGDGSCEEVSGSLGMGVMGDGKVDGLRRRSR